MSYITAAEYNQETGRPQAEATDYRLKMASKLLDSRIGLWPEPESGEFKLDLSGSELTGRQIAAVKSWTAWMVAALVDNDDSIQVNESIKLGSFSVTARDGKNELIPDQLQFADQILVDSRMIRRRVRI